MSTCACSPSSLLLKPLTDSELNLEVPEEYPSDEHVSVRMRTERSHRNRVLEHLPKSIFLLELPEKHANAGPNE